MARATLTKTTALGHRSDVYTAGAAALTMTAADASNKNQFAASAKDLVIAHNTGASPYTVTITSTPDGLGRSGDIATYSVPAGVYAVFGPFGLDGWVQTDGKVYLEASNAAVKFGAVDLSNF